MVRRHSLSSIKRAWATMNGCARSEMRVRAFSQVAFHRGAAPRHCRIADARLRRYLETTVCRFKAYQTVSPTSKNPA